MKSIFHISHSPDFLLSAMHLLELCSQWTSSSLDTMLNKLSHTLTTLYTVLYTIYIEPFVNTEAFAFSYSKAHPEIQSKTFKAF